MSTKDNWDDSSDDEGEEGLLRLPPDPPHEGKYDEAQFEGDTPPDPLCEAEPEEEFVDAKSTEEGGVGGYTQEEYQTDDEWGGEGEDPLDEDYEDELDDYDKKLGRYVSCR